MMLQLPWMRIVAALGLLFTSSILNGNFLSAYPQNTTFASSNSLGDQKLPWVSSPSNPYNTQPQSAGTAGEAWNSPSSPQQAPTTAFSPSPTPTQQAPRTASSPVPLAPVAPSQSAPTPAISPAPQPSTSPTQVPTQPDSGSPGSGNGGETIGGLKPEILMAIILVATFGLLFIVLGVLYVYSRFLRPRFRKIIGAQHPSPTPSGT